MNNSHKSPSAAQSPASDISVAMAVRYWIRRQSGDWSAAEQVALDQWLSSSSEHMQAYAVVERTWAELGDLGPSAPPVIYSTPARSIRGRIVACLTIMLTAGVAAWWLQRPSPLESRFITDSLPHVFKLEDGTRLSLDASSEVTTKMAGPDRRIFLQRGEAVIETAHGAHHRVEVWAGQGRIIDVGTRFDVELLSGTVRVSVYEGLVSIVTSRGNVSLSAGTAGGYDSKGGLLALRHADTEAALAADGLRHFDAMPLQEVAERLQRYHTAQIAFADAAAEELLVSGTFRLTELDEMLNTLKKALPIDISRPDASHILVARRPAS